MTLRCAVALDLLQSILPDAVPLWSGGCVDYRETMQPHVSTIGTPRQVLRKLY